MNQINSRFSLVAGISSWRSSCACFSLPPLSSCLFFCFLTLFVLSVVGVISSFFFSVAPLCCTCQLRLNYSKPAIHCRSIVGCKRHARISLQARLSLTFYWPTEKRCRSFMFSRSSFAFLRRPRVSGVIRTESFFSPLPPNRRVYCIAVIVSRFHEANKKKREGKPSSLRNAPTRRLFFFLYLSCSAKDNNNTPYISRRNH